MRSAPPAANPLFVVGLYRSGTSLLNLLLNQHPDIALMYEVDVMRPCPGISDRHLTRDWAQRLEFWNAALSRHALAPESLPQRLSGRNEAALALYRAFAAKRGATIYGEKSPGYHDRLPQLARAFPDARFVVIWRDAADIGRSVRRAGGESRFFTQAGWEHRVRRGRKLMRRGCAELAARGCPLVEIQYAELVQAPETVLRRICAVLEIEFTQRMTTLEGADRSVVPPGQHHANLFRTRIVDLSSEHDHATAISPAADDRDSSSFVEWFWGCYIRNRAALVALVYTVVPLGLLARYRRWKASRSEDAAVIASRRAESKL